LFLLQNKCRNIELPQQGHGRVGVGSLKNFTKEDHDLIYNLYRENPARPLESYTVEFFLRTGMYLSYSFVQISSNCKGSHGKTSLVPHARDSVQNIEMLELFVQYALGVLTHQNWVFADEKPLRPKDVYGTTRRDCRTGGVRPANRRAQASTPPYAAIT
jgi:hypothetical protein